MINGSLALGGTSVEELAQEAATFAVVVAVVAAVLAVVAVIPVRRTVRGRRWIARRAIRCTDPP